MKRTRQHEIEDAAYRQFENCIPLHWVVRSQNKDYGIDREVEIFKQKSMDITAQTTGQIFKVQIKGTEKPKISQKDGLIKFPLEVEKVNYLCRELNVPAFFIVADIVCEKTWWYAIQVDEDLKHRLDVANQKNQRTITLKVSAQNILPDTLALLVKTLDDIALSKACDVFVTLPESNFYEIPLDSEQISELERKFTDKIFVAKVTNLWKAKDYSKIEEVAGEALSNKKASTSTRVSAVLCLEHTIEFRLKDSPALYNQLDHILFETAATIRKLTKKESRSWRLFGLVTWRAALLRLAAKRDFSLYLNRKIQAGEEAFEPLDYICSLTLDMARRGAINRVIKTYNQCLRLINILLNVKEYWIIPYAVLRIVQSVPAVFIHLWGENLFETATNLRTNILALIEKAVALSYSLNRWDDMGQLVVSAFTTNSLKSKDQYHITYDWAQNKLRSIPDNSIRTVWLDTLREMSQNFDPDKNKIESDFPDVPTEEEYQVYIQMAEAFGINVNDPKDDIAKIIRIGLEDLNPERVLKQCKYLYVYIGHYGIPAQMLRLYTAGSKYLRCLKKEVCVSGLSLDKIYQTLFEKYCSNCKNREPRPDVWKWTRSWQNKEAQKETHKIFRQRLGSL